jgi:hypothetical protein
MRIEKMNMRIESRIANMRIENTSMRIEKPT